jgi:hypothetical protein
MGEKGFHLRKTPGSMRFVRLHLGRRLHSLPATEPRLFETRPASAALPRPPVLAAQRHAAASTPHCARLKRGAPGESSRQLSVFAGGDLQALTSKLKGSGSSWHGGFRSYEPGPGEYIVSTNASAAKLVGIVNSEQRTAVGIFDGILFVAHPGDTAEVVRRAFDEQRDRHRSGHTAERRAEHHRRRYAIREELRARERVAAPAGEFKLFRHKEWAKARKVNVEPYGQAILEYAERWARLLQGAIDQAGIDDGHKQSKPQIARIISEQAERLSHLPDTRGVSGYMHGAAVATLSRTWKHGELLRRWHNLDTQWGQEGQGANKRGGVLNPAILHLATPTGD